MSVSSDRRLRLGLLLGLVWALLGCQPGLVDDLLPSDEDRRGGESYLPGQPLDAATRAAPLVDVNGVRRTLDELLGAADPPDAVVIYFTMWCPICLAHTDHLHNEVLPRFAGADVRYLVVDYVSGSWQDMRAAAAANGYLGTDLEVVLDADDVLFQRLHGAMGNVVVVDADGVIRMNAYYRDGRELVATLSRLVP